MPTVFTHPAPALALAVALGMSRMPPRLVLLAVVVVVLPDMDVIGFSYGVRYGDVLGHRGFSHSFAFALLLGAVAFLGAPLLRARRWVAFGVITAAAVSHMLLDAATNGGLGVALFWPLDNGRYFLPWQPIAVSPFSLKALFSKWGQRVFWSELYWVWTPCAVLALSVWAGRCMGRNEGKQGI